MGRARQGSYSSQIQERSSPRLKSNMSSASLAAVLIRRDRVQVGMNTIRLTSGTLLQFALSKL